MRIPTSITTHVGKSLRVIIGLLLWICGGSQGGLSFLSATLPRNPRLGIGGRFFGLSVVFCGSPASGLHWWAARRAVSSSSAPSSCVFETAEACCHAVLRRDAA